MLIIVGKIFLLVFVVALWITWFFLDTFCESEGVREMLGGIKDFALIIIAVFSVASFSIVFGGFETGIGMAVSFAVIMLFLISKHLVRWWKHGRKIVSYN